MSLFILMAATFLGYLNYQSAVSFEEATLEKQTELLQSSFVKSTLWNLSVIEAMDDVFSVSRFVSRQEFSFLAQKLRERAPGLRAIEWIPELRGSQLEDYQRSAHSDGLSNFSFKRFDAESGTLTALTPTKDMVYAPIFYAEPYVLNKDAMGFDLFSNQDRKTFLQQVKASNTLVASEPIQLVEDPSTVASVMLAKYVKNGSQPGWIMGIWHYSSLVEDALSASLFKNTEHLSLVDKIDGQSVQVYPVYKGRPALHADHQYHAAQFALANRQLELALGFEAQNHLGGALIICALGYILASLSWYALDQLAARQAIEKEAESLELKLEEEARLRDQLETFKRYLDAAPIPVGILEGDRNSRHYIYVNQAMCEKFGYAFEELIGLNATQAMFVHDSDRTAFNQLVWDSIDKQTTFVMEAPLYLKGKEVKYFELAGRYTQEGDRLLGTLFYFDITERIQYDQAQKDLLESERKLVQSRRLEAVGNLMAGMAHSLNNHMQPILVLTSLLRGKVGEDPKAQDYLAKMEEAVTGATSILQRALTASRLEKLSHRSRIKSSFAAAVELAAIGIPSTIHYSHQVSLAEDGYVALDKINLEVCLLNLIHNARDAIDLAHGEIRVSLSRVTPDADRVEAPDLLSLDWIAIKVEDSGSGMSDEQLARALDPFYTTKDPGKGTGLGLSETHSLVMQAHGYLTVSSVPHVGTSVVLCMPVYSDAND
ncbi:MAG: CHASE domain-containing protein [Sedimenticolaceae bacterium]